MGEYIKLGKKENDGAVEVGTSSKKAKAIIRYPDFRIDDVAVPINSSMVGKVITAEVQLRINDAGPEIDAWNNKKRHRSEFSVIAIKFPGKKKVDVSKVDSSDLDKMEKNEHEKMTLGKGLLKY